MRLVPFQSRVQRGDDTSPGVSLRGELDRFFDRMLRSPWADDALQGGMWAPLVDISEKESEIVLRAEVPGMKPEQIDITVSGERLIISGEKSEAKEEKQEHYYHCERRFGAFERTIELPSSADMEHVSAEYSDGVLTIHVPKLETAKPKRVQIESKSTSEGSSRSVSVSEGQSTSDEA